MFLPYSGATYSSRVASLEFVRPANTTAYTSGDCILPEGTYGALEVPNAGLPNALVCVTGWRLAKSSATGGNFGVVLFAENWQSGSNVDNAPASVPYGAKLLTANTQAMGTYGASAVATSTLSIQGTGTTRTDANGSLWALITSPAYTPISQEKFMLSLVVWAFNER